VQGGGAKADTAGRIVRVHLDAGSAADDVAAALR
jgi:hypothetical protein